MPFQTKVPSRVHDRRVEKFEDLYQRVYGDDIDEMYSEDDLIKLNNILQQMIRNANLTPQEAFELMDTLALIVANQYGD